MDLPRSPLAPEGFVRLESIEGVQLFTGATPEVKGKRDNVLLAVFDPGTVVAGVLTQSRCASAPVEWCRAHLGKGGARALVVNAGNANAFSGRKGALAVDRVAAHVAALTGCAPGEVMLASTGVIGEPLDPEPVLDVLDGIAASETADAEDAAKAIMTTDTFAKGASSALEFDGNRVNIAGIAKGSGMIAPDMATMLSFVFTDMEVAPSVLRHVLREKIKTSFNAITVDSDTSTSDTCLVFATGAAGKRGVGAISSMQDPRLGAFSESLHDVLLDLALQVVRDGEGASKFVQIDVSGAADDKSAGIVARSVANSPLVKTAIAGEDANWGRIVMAVGKAGEPADRDRLTIRFGGLVLARRGARAPDYDEAKASAYMKNSELEIGIDLGVGDGKARVYTCDLTHGYVSINADYRS
ncbi:MAG TPA: bifunctional glutamate N-acetyltransferase/amino-acid acetyltransferase ArgJ [Devosia sp.]|nr:bifunctional glutamate N-acetyltransferase/amino-acid acetyltransferase ArgJ [Devosia sp.]